MRLIQSLVSCLAFAESTLAVGCKTYNFCSDAEVCVWGKDIPDGECLPIRSNGLARRNEEILQPSLGEFESPYQRQLRRKELLKQNLAKKMFEEEQEAEMEERLAEAVEEYQKVEAAKKLKSILASQQSRAMQSRAPENNLRQIQDYNAIKRMQNNMDNIRSSLQPGMMEETRAVDEDFPQFNLLFNDFNNFEQKLENDMDQEMGEVQAQAASDTNADFKSVSSSSYKVNDEPERVKVEVNDNGKINNYEEEIGADGKVITTDTTPVDYQGEPMPEPAKRVSNADYGDYGGRK